MKLPPISNEGHILSLLQAGPRSAKELQVELQSMTMGEIYAALQNLIRVKLVTIANPPTIEQVDARLEEIARRIETLGTGERMPSTHPASVYQVVDRKAAP